MHELNIMPNTAPALSPDRKYLGYSTGNEIVVYDIAAGAVLAKQATPGDTPWAIVAFSPSGKWLACSAFHTFYVWDLATGVLHCQIPSGGINPFGEFIWTSDRHILVGKQHLFDVELRMRVWEYAGHAQARSVGGITSFLVHAGAQPAPGALVIAHVPHSQAEAAIGRVDADLDYFAMRAGSAVAVDVGGVVDAKMRDKVAAALTAALQKNGCSIDPQAKIRLVASTEAGKVRELGFTKAPGGFVVPKKSLKLRPASMQEFHTRLRFTHEKETLWERTANNIPSSVRLRADETLEQHLKNLERPNHAILLAPQLPHQLLRSPAAAIMGKTQVTLTGLR